MNKKLSWMRTTNITAHHKKQEADLTQYGIKHHKSIEETALDQAWE